MRYLLTGWLLLLALPASAELAEYRIDPQHSNLVFFISHMGFADTLGRFGELEGSLLWDAAAPSSAAVTVSVATASVTTFDDKRDQHLRSPDFFNVAEFPVMRFESTGVTMAAGSNRGVLNGNLTLLGQTRPLALELQFNREGLHSFNKRDQIAGFSATGSLLRSDFGMGFGLLDGIGIGDQVEIRIEVEAVRQ